MKKLGKTYKKLFRSRSERMIAGICGGLADYFSMDPTWVRLLSFVLLFLSGGIVLLIYLIMWILIPLEPREGPTRES